VEITNSCLFSPTENLKILDYSFACRECFLGGLSCICLRETMETVKKQQKTSAVADGATTLRTADDVR